MQRLPFLAAVAAWLVVCGNATSPEEVDTSVSSAIAQTMAAIAGRARVHERSTEVVDEPPHGSLSDRVRAMRARRMALSKVKNQETRHARKTDVQIKADTPKQLSGYLGWSSNKAKDGFSTSWNTTGANAAKSIYVRDLEGGHSQQAEKKSEALVADAAVTTAYTRKLEDDMQGADFPSIDLDWGTKKAKAVKAPKIALKEQTSNTRSNTNTYLDAVGWKASAPVVSAKENPYLQSLNEDPNKKFLAAAEVSEKQEKHTYFDDLVPDAASEITLPVP